MPKVLCALVSGLLIALGSSKMSNATPPNILFIGVDDLRPELACYGADYMHTPAMDQLAQSGMRFDAAYCQQAVCLPSRISLFTGMRPDSTGVRDLKTKFRKTIPDAITLTQHFRAAGYHTIGMGKVLHDEQPAEWNEWHDTKKLPEVQEYHNPQTIQTIEDKTAAAEAKGLKGEAFRKFTKGPSTEWADVPDNHYADGAMTDLAIQKLKENKHRPFFLTVGYKKPHLPFVAPKKYWDLYDRNELEIPENYFTPKDAPQVALMTWGELRAYSDIPKQGPVADDKALDLIHGYRASVSFVDAQIERLLQALETEGLTENTIVVLWSDHGWKLGEHAMWCKHTNYEIDARVPLLISYPSAVKANNVSASPVELIDLYPTLCDLAGLEPPSQCEGKSLTPLFSNPKPAHYQYAYNQFTRARNTGGDIIGYSVKVPEGRYTEWINIVSEKAVAHEFYDHQHDPDENQNVYTTLSPEQTQYYSRLISKHRNK